MHNGDWFVDFVKILTRDGEVTEEWNGEKWVEKWVAKKIEPAKPAIVINRTNGVLKPATTPFVHPSAIEAEVEAKRLAELVKGEEFVVFEEVGSRRVEKPALKVGDWVKIVGPSCSGGWDRRGEIVQLTFWSDTCKCWIVKPTTRDLHNSYHSPSLEPASPPEKSKAEQVAEVLKLLKTSTNLKCELGGKTIAEIDHLEASATGNIVTVKYHLKP